MLIHFVSDLHFYHFIPFVCIILLSSTYETSTLYSVDEYCYTCVTFEIDENCEFNLPKLIYQYAIFTTEANKCRSVLRF